MTVTAVRAVRPTPSLQGRATMARPRPIASLSGALLGLLLLASAAPSTAQTPAFPSKAVRIVVANAAGSSPDIISRLLAVKMSESWNRPVLVENRPGASGLIAAEGVAKSPPDGHTMFSVTLTQLISTLMYQRYQLASEFASVGMVGTTPFAIIVSANLPVRNIAEFIAYAKARPNQLMYGTTGQWGSLHLCIEVFNEIAGLGMTQIPHPGTPQALNALMADQIQVLCPAAPSVNSLAKSGRIRPLGVTYQKETRLLPGVPPVSDTLSGFELPGWYAMQTTAKTPVELVGRLNAELVRALRLPDIQEKLVAAGAEATPGTPAELQSFMNSETARWGKVLRDRNAKPEPL